MAEYQVWMMSQGKYFPGRVYPQHAVAQQVVDELNELTDENEFPNTQYYVKVVVKKSVTIHNLTEDQVSLLLDHAEGYDLPEGSIDVEDTLQP